MDYARQSTAYDLSRYEQHLRPQPPELHVVGRGNSRAAANRALGLRLACTALAVVSMLAVMLYNNATLTELTEEYNAQSTRYEELKSEGVRLQSELEGKMSLRNVEDYASANMGLSKTEAYQIEYVQLNKGDRVVLAQSPANAGPWGRIQEGFQAFLEYLMPN